MLSITKNEVYYFYTIICSHYLNNKLFYDLLFGQQPINKKSTCLMHGEEVHSYQYRESALILVSVVCFDALRAHVVNKVSVSYKPACVTCEAQHVLQCPPCS